MWPNIPHLRQYFQKKISLPPFLSPSSLPSTSLHLSLPLFQVRLRLSADPVFDVVTEEAERVRIYKEYIKSLKVHVL